jgi:tRNA A37 methylthiotransferase MiaB
MGSGNEIDRMGCFAYSHEENTHAYLLEDDVPADVKQDRANEIMEIQSNFMGFKPIKTRSNIQMYYR